MLLILAFLLTVPCTATVDFPVSGACSAGLKQMALPNGEMFCYNDNCLATTNVPCAYRCCDFCVKGKCSCIGDLTEQDCLTVAKKFKTHAIWHGNGCECEASDHLGCCENLLSASSGFRAKDFCFTETEKRNCPTPYTWTCSHFCHCDTCEPKTCGFFQRCAETGISNWPFQYCYCYTIDGSHEGFCGQNGWCSAYANCNNINDCPPEHECLINTCCVVGKCVPKSFGNVCFNHDNYLLQEPDANCQRVEEVGVDSYVAEQGGVMFDLEAVKLQIETDCGGGNGGPCDGIPEFPIVYQGGTYAALRAIPTLYDCCAICDEDPTCVHFSFKWNSDICFLFANPTHYVDNGRFLSDEPTDMDDVPQGRLEAAFVGDDEQDATDIGQGPYGVDQGPSGVDHGAYGVGQEPSGVDQGAYGVGQEPSGVDQGAYGVGQGPYNVGGDAYDVGVGADDVGGAAYGVGGGADDVGGEAYDVGGGGDDVGGAAYEIGR